MGINRSKVHYKIARKLVSEFVKFYYNVEVEGHEDIPKDGAVEIVSKHQRYSDIFLQGLVLGDYVGRPGNWIMKSSLPKYFDKLGGLRIIRPQDVEKSLDGLNREELRAIKRVSIREAQKYKGEIKDAMGEVFRQGEALVLHPEGHRYPYEMGKISISLINYTKQLQSELGIEIPLVLMGINYENPGKFRSNAIVKIKRLDWDTPNLEKTIGSEIARLSGLVA